MCSFVHQDSQPFAGQCNSLRTSQVESSSVLTSSGVKMRESVSAERCKLARTFFWKVSVARSEWGRAGFWPAAELWKLVGHVHLGRAHDCFGDA